LLLSDLRGPALPDKEIAQALRCKTSTVFRIRKNFVERGLSGAIKRKKQAEPSRKPTFDGEAEAHVIAIACSKKTEDDSGNWSLRLIANRLVELEVVESISHETVRRLLKKRLKTSS
jgi:transposase